MKYSTPEICPLEIIAEKCSAASMISSDEQIYIQNGTTDDEFTKTTIY